MAAILVPILLLTSVDAFVTPSLNTISSVGINSWQSQPLVSPLHADESGSAAEEQPSDDGSTEIEGTASEEVESDILNSPAFLKRKVDVLQSDIGALEKEIEEANTVYLAGKEEWGSKFDMLVKESQGMQDRLSKQGAQGDEAATVEVATKILNVLDNYDRAFQSIEATTNEEVEIVDDYKTTYDMILSAFTELNVTKIETVGAEFDFEVHQGMMTMASDEYEEGYVCQEFAPGWRCGETLVRPAMVAVAD